MADDLDGVDDTTFYLGYLTAIKERIGNRWPAILMIEAKPEEPPSKETPEQPPKQRGPSPEERATTEERTP